MILYTLNLLFLCFCITHQSYVHVWPISQENKYDLYDRVKVIMKEFDIGHPYIITNASYKTVNFVRILFKNGNFVKLNSSNSNDIDINLKVSQSILVFGNIKGQLITELKHQMKLVLILQDNEFDEIYHNTKIEIHQTVYFFKTSTFEVYETYTINGINVKQKLGYIDMKTNEYSWEKGINTNLIKRRSNFHGISLNVICEFSGNSMNADPSYLKKASYFPNNETYMINGFTYGIFDDVFKIMEYTLNFSSAKYKRKVEAWGSIYPQPDGSFKGTGIGMLF